MRIFVANTPRELGETAARLAAEALDRAIREKGGARLAVSTGASQLDTMAALARQQIPWQRVELFQMGERIMPDEPGVCGCRRALRDRLGRRLPFRKAHYLDGTEENLLRISEELKKSPIDVLLLGLGEHGQVGFNVPGADFDAAQPYIRIPAAEGRPEGTVTMTVREMLKSGQIIVSAPYGILAETVWQVITHGLTEEIPATALKRHERFDLLLDADSASQITVDLAVRYNSELSMYHIADKNEQKV